MTVAAIVLAGGASSRFPGNKLAAVLDGASLLHHALRAVSTVAGDIVLVLAPDVPVPALPVDLAPRVLVARDAEPYGGPLAGLAAGLAAGRHGPASVVLVVGGDMPSLNPGVLQLLVDGLAAEAGIVAMTLAAPVPSPLPLALRSMAAGAAVRICLAEGRRSLRALLDAVPSARLPAGDWRALDPDGETLRDVDTPGDMPRDMPAR